MSRTVTVVGLREKDEKYNEYKRIWELCKKNGLRIPDQVGEYFDWSKDLESSLYVELKHNTHSVSGSSYIDISIDDLPEGIKSIRVVESW